MVAAHIPVPNGSPHRPNTPHSSVTRPPSDPGMFARARSCDEQMLGDIWNQASSKESGQIETLWHAAAVDTDYCAALQAALLRTGAQPAAAEGRGRETGVVRGCSVLDLPGLTCLAAGGSTGSAAVVADAWALLHGALHVLDAVEDGDQTGAAWSRWGPGASINISTGLLASVNLMLDELEAAGTPHRTAHAIRHDFNRTLLALCAGQHQDLTCSEPSLEQAWAIAEAKSGRFFALACRAGARLVLEDERVDWFGAFGLHLGVVLQIRDDLTDLWAPDGRACDLLAGPRWTLPVAYAMRQGAAVERHRLQAHLHAAPMEPAAAAAARDLVEALGAPSYLRNEACRHAQQAHEALLRAAPASTARDELAALLNRAAP